MTAYKQIKEILLLIFATRRKLINAWSLRSIGMDVTPLDNVDDVVACAESVTTVLRKAGIKIGIIPGTWTLERFLMNSPKWVPVQSPEPGDVVMSATGTSNLGSSAPFRGHTGIVGPNNQILANNSDTGLWGAYYTIKTWEDRYSKRGGYPTTFYRYIGIL